ncbi:MAG TPA: hypothetical protein VFA49_08000, partial [Chloroflexota bacterium]|nr:hypothetical protein [Chloroflexota bacterium]
MASSPMTRRRFLGLAGVAAGVGLLTACQPTAPTAAPTQPAAAAKPTSAPPAAATSAPAGAPTTAPAAKPAASAANTLTFLLSGDTNRLDPPA